MSQNAPEELPLRARSVREISEALQGVLGQQITAFAISERDPRRIGAFARGEDSPSEETEAVLRDLAEVTEVGLRMEKDSQEIVRATMLGMNPVLDDQSVVELFHKGLSDTAVKNARAIFTS